MHAHAQKMMTRRTFRGIISSVNNFSGVKEKLKASPMKLADYYHKWMLTQQKAISEYTHLKLAFPSVPWTNEYESPKACTNLISSQLNFGFDPWFSFALLEIDDARESGTDPAKAADTKNARNFMIVWSEM